MISTPERTLPPATAARSRQVDRAVDLSHRRRAFAIAVAVTLLAATAGFLYVFAADGLSIADAVMTLLFPLAIVWPVIGFWNALIGFVLIRRGGVNSPALSLLAGLDDDRQPIVTRTALCMTLYNEDPDQGFRRLRQTVRSLEQTGKVAAFSIFVLSDTNDRQIARREEQLFEDWRATDGGRLRLHYRRRRQNTGFKAGNIRDFLERFGSDFDFCIILDIDSLMTGPAILRLVRAMQANPRLGILQTLVTGLPSVSPFARIFQFGMRHGMRSYTAGSIWWQGNAGPYWGHNAIVRIAPFRQHCHLPELSGTGPLSGAVLSHDQLEAALLHSAGYDVRVLPQEFGSFEENPPTLSDFIKRDLRWCQGNLQYLRLLRLPQLKRISRVQLLLAVLMYSASPAWLLLLIIGLGQAIGGSFAPPATPTLPYQPWVSIVGWGLFMATLVFVFAPKLAGWAETLIDRRERQSFGGAPRLIAGIGLEVLASVLLAPVMALTQSLFIGGLAFGRRIVWQAQRRTVQRLPLAQSFRQFRTFALTGIVLGLLLATTLPWLLPFFAPMLLGLAAAPVFATLTADQRLGRWLARRRLCAIPEELAPPPEVASVVDFVREREIDLAPPRRSRGARDANAEAIDA
jgi:membrane glycosyltransferase